MAQTVKETRDGHAPALTQLLALAALVLPGVVTGLLIEPRVARWVLAVLVLVLVLALLASWPLVGRGIRSGPDRAVSGLLALACLVPTLVVQGPGALWAWLSTAAFLLALLAVFMFVRQMLRRDRRMVIRGISATAMGGVTAVAASGWVFLPELIGGLHPDLMPILVVFVALLLLIGLMTSGHRWAQEAADRRGAIGLALMSVLLAGSIVVLAAMVLLTTF
ncbi:hypothetical protein H3S93_02405 [Bifidobacterium sp. W8109]|uniref:hypothetical protein n=1 Tax=Bifidobacterium TaxID=1678 RepID=UPI0018DC5D72|nr:MULTISPECIES: hypothetical protein [Bifidobacterium]MBH9971168.1 hypothetical protein [Bifidobacterium asteroides]MBH9980033.1 hypothetical protein [Bifidobacterium asteroides]MBI0072509.1 hypothetical protein [Bifidobacterium sp. W8110]MBI0099497.1 hypothetical protein [Bifidobacterium sp. W8114]